jgi:hypothetical protein
VNEEEYEKVVAALAAKLKKANDDSKRREILEIKRLEALGKSTPEQRSLVKSYERELANDTSTMFGLSTREGFGRRIGRGGRPVGPELKKIGGRYVDQKKAKGGVVKKMRSGGKVRGGGCETKGRTRGRFV